MPRDDGVPLYVRLAASLRARITQGEWAVGLRIPAFDELAEKHGVAMNTVRIVKTHAVRGMPYGYLDIFVERQAYERFPPNAMYERKVTRLLRDCCPGDVLRTRQQLTIAYADDALAKALHCPPASALVRVRRWKLGEQDRVVLACEIYYRGDTFVWDSTENEADAHEIVPDEQDRDKA